jgi:serine/threonine protein kinase
VYRQGDPNKTEYVAKHLREGSNELAIHEYLQSRPSHSLHIISLIEAVPSTTREWLILPSLYSIRNQRFLGESGVAGRVRLGWGLIKIKGLAYLHKHKVAHRDIKPDNLVRDGDFNLKIIDFDMAIQVQDENTKITNIAARRVGQHLKLERKTDRRRCIVRSLLIGGHAVVLSCII